MGALPPTPPLGASPQTTATLKSGQTLNFVLVFCERVVYCVRNLFGFSVNEWRIANMQKFADGCLRLLIEVSAMSKVRGRMLKIANKGLRDVKNSRTDA